MQLLQYAHSILQPPIRLYIFQANAGASRFYEQHGYTAIAFYEGTDNEERYPEVLYEWRESFCYQFKAKATASYTSKMDESLASVADQLCKESHVQPPPLCT